VIRTDNTRNERQVRRREHEKGWLKANGWRSWEALHTALMNGSVRLSSGAADTLDSSGNFNDIVSNTQKVIKYQ
jgi:hypothetical protein